MKLSGAEKAADYRGRGWWGDDTIENVFRRRVSENPQGPALVDPPNRASSMAARQSA